MTTDRPADKLRDSPTALTRHRRWLAVAVATFLFVMGIGAPAALLTLGARAMILVATLGVLMMAASIALAAVGWKRDVQRIRNLRGRACPQCLYDLSHLPDAGACPECGTPYDMDRVLAQWLRVDRTYQSRALYKPTPNHDAPTPTISDGQEEAAPSHNREPPGAP